MCKHRSGVQLLQNPRYAAAQQAGTTYRTIHLFCLERGTGPGTEHPGVENWRTGPGPSPQVPHPKTPKLVLPIPIETK
jgi:hypothetical protein